MTAQGNVLATRPTKNLQALKGVPKLVSALVPPLLGWK